MNWDEHRRLPVACVECGAMYVAIERKDGELQPLGSKKQCNSCGETEFTPVSDAVLDNPAADSRSST